MRVKDGYLYLMKEWEESETLQVPMITANGRRLLVFQEPAVEDNDGSYHLSKESDEMKLPLYREYTDGF